MITIYLFPNSSTNVTTFQSHTHYSLSLQEVGHEGHIVLAVLLCPLSQLAHHSGVTRGCGKEEQATVILGVMQALLGQAELALTDSQLG